jgi:adenylate kinase
LKIILIGLPGSGKGTVASYLESKHGIVQVSTGDYLRNEIEKDSEIGRSAEELQREGKLFPDEMITKIAVDASSQHLSFVLDGFPRTVVQAEMFSKHLAINAIIYVSASDDVVIERIKNRVSCPICKNSYQKKDGLQCKKCNIDLIQRPDDTNETAIKNRIAIFYEQTKPVLEFYRWHTPIFEVDGNQPVDDVLRTIEAWITHT